MFESSLWWIGIQSVSLGPRSNRFGGAMLYVDLSHGASSYSLIFWGFWKRKYFFLPSPLFKYTITRFSSFISNIYFVLLAQSAIYPLNAQFSQLYHNLTICLGHSQLCFATTTFLSVVPSILILPWDRALIHLSIISMSIYANTGNIHIAFTTIVYFIHL